MNRRTIFFGTLTITLSVALAVATSPSVFNRFQQIDGFEQAQPISDQFGGFTLDHTNKFFDPGLGTNGQPCVTCHQPTDGYDIHVSSIQSAFAATMLPSPRQRSWASLNTIHDEFSSPGSFQFDNDINGITPAMSELDFLGELQPGNSLLELGHLGSQSHHIEQLRAVNEDGSPHPTPSAFRIPRSAGFSLWITAAVATTMASRLS